MSEKIWLEHRATVFIWESISINQDPLIHGGESNKGVSTNLHWWLPRSPSNSEKWLCSSQQIAQPLLCMYFYVPSIPLKIFQTDFYNSPYCFHHWSFVPASRAVSGNSKLTPPTLQYYPSYCEILDMGLLVVIWPRTSLFGYFVILPVFLDADT